MNDGADPVFGGAETGHQSGAFRDFDCVRVAN
jgi:hypothetical protein